MGRVAAIALFTAVVMSPSRAAETVATQVGTTTSGAIGNDTAIVAAAKQWGVTAEDYRRYLTLKQGIAGSIGDPRLSPVEVLGIFAPSDQERLKYARQFAALTVDYHQRVAQFEHAYQAEIRRAFPNLPVLAYDAGQAKQPTLADVLSRTPALSSDGVPVGARRATRGSLGIDDRQNGGPRPAGDRAIVFTRAAGCEQCPDRVRQVLRRVPQGVGVDIYLVGATTDEDVSRYAKSFNIDPALVRRGTITLNRDNGAFARVFPAHPSLPQVARKRGDEFLQVEAANT